MELQLPNVDHQLTVADARRVLENPYNVYNQKHGTGRRQQQQSTSTSSSSKPSSKSWSFLRNEKSIATPSGGSQSSSSKLVSYLETEFLINDLEKLDILKWW